MTEAGATNTRNVALPWSEGCMSARISQKGKRFVVSVPELDLCCYGRSQSEAVLRLFSTLLKYHNELSKLTEPLSSRQQEHFELLKPWMRSIENRMTAPQERVISAAKRRVSLNDQPK